jgi:hypothetical protein
MDNGSIGALIVIVAIIDGIIAVMAYWQVMETLRREGKEITVFGQFTYLFMYRELIVTGYLQDEESRSAFRLYVKTSVFLFGIIILSMIYVMVYGFNFMPQ